MAPSSASGEKFFNFIERNFGKTVQLDIKITTDWFVKVILGAEPFLVVISEDPECVKATKEENMPPLLTMCGGTEYNLGGEGYDFKRVKDNLYVLKGHFKVPEDGGGVHQGIYSIGLDGVRE